MLRIRVLGGVRACWDDGTAQTNIKITHSTQSLLGYLLLHGRRRPQSREALAGVFWADASEERARSCLSSAIWRLRQLLEPPGIPAGTFIVSNGAGEVGFNADSPHWLDLTSFEGALSVIVQTRSACASRVEAESVRAATELYAGDLMEGHYEDWVLRERIRLQDLHLAALVWLTEHAYETADCAAGIALAERILAIDPVREDVHRRLMLLYDRAGLRSNAVRQYERCRAVLAQELGVEPMQETRALLRSLFPASSLIARQPAEANGADWVQDVVSRAALCLDEAQQHLSALQGIVKLTRPQPFGHPVQQTTRPAGTTRPTQPSGSA